MCILLLLLAAGHALAQPAPVAAEARAIILRSAERDQNDLEARRNYTFLTHTEQRDLDAAGNVEKLESRTSEVLILYGRPYQRLIAKDGKLLPPDEDRKERKKMDKEISRREKESAKEKEKRTREESRNLRQQREILREVADAFEFRVVGEEDVDGFATWVIQAEPRPGYRPRSKDTRMLPNFRGRLWITKDEYRWVRVDAEVVRRISIGLVLARLNPGTTVGFGQRRVHDEIWMPSQVRVRAVGRVALLKKFNAEVLVTYSDYRKFQSDSRITETMEVSPDAPR
jgi:hypothetical protein